MGDALGRLVLVVGPSGVGKDALIAEAKQRLERRSDIVFPRREITRPAEAGGEDHIAISLDDFAARRDRGGYALAWEAHGLGYGVPVSILEDLAAGRTVVVNVSRGVLDDARARFPALRVLSITAPTEVIASRLAARGRESADDVAARLKRGGAFVVTGADVVEVSNDGSLEQGADRFVAALLS